MLKGFEECQTPRIFGVASSNETVRYAKGNISGGHGKRLFVAVQSFGY